ncbi:MAG: hypothetical protein GX175_07245 [Halanaerobiaceae bacterium]|jgi:hypothetical protein|nr:hypothetical protein [Halanaerobiaceae bacterium]
MLFESLIDLGKPVLKFKKEGDLLYVISDKEIMKADINTGDVIQSKEVFPKNSRTRDLLIDKDIIYSRDFYKLHKIDKETLEINKTWELGIDLSSDICTLDHDEKNIYIAIRKGDFAVINKASGEVRVYPISESSIWDMIISDNIYAGNVDGEFIVIDRADFKVIYKKKIHKKNLKSLLLAGDEIFTASQDLCISRINKNNYEILDSCKKCHKKMFYLVGNWKDFLLTMSPPCFEMKFWDMSDLSLYKTINRASWDAFIEGDILYEKEGNSIIRSDLNELITGGFSKELITGKI